MARALFLAIALALGASASAWAADIPAHGTEPANAASADVDQLVGKLNPDFLAGLPLESTFTGPASDIASEVRSYNWFATFVFLPFLILPQILLLVTMFKFHDKGDGRKPATFMHHTKLENTWTAIPILTLFIVGIPAYPLLYKMELPPENPVSIPITVTGHQFFWEYDYKREKINFANDIGGTQEPMILVKGKIVTLAITSGDVNHAWWVPAFGVKKDAIMGRYNQVWFTPTREGVFKGNCAELCGEGHGRMVIGACVVDQPTYDTWVALQRNRGDTVKVFTALNQSEHFDQIAFADSVKAYLAKGGSAERVLALRYWIASDFVSLTREAPPRGDKSEDEAKAAYVRYLDYRDHIVPARRRLADQVIAASVAENDTVEHPVVAAQEKP